MIQDRGSTVSGLHEASSARFERGIELVTHAILFLVVLAAAAGALGVSESTAFAETDGLTLSVTHARVTRAGLATPFALRIASRTGSLPGELTLRIDTSYLSMFDRNGLDPEPDRTHVDAADTAFTFAVPEGAQSLDVVFDARTEPDIRWGRSAVIRLDGGPSVAIRTRVLP